MEPDECARINAVFARLEAYKELFTVNGFLVQPHVMHVNRLPTDGENNPSHTHRAFEYSLILSGAMRYRVDGEIVEAGEGAAVFIPPERPHRWDPVEEDSLIFGFMAHISCNGRGARQRLCGLREGLARRRYHQRNAHRLADIVRRLVGEASVGGEYLDAMARCLAQEAMVEFFRMALPAGDGGPGLSRPAVQRLRGEDPKTLLDAVTFFINDHSHRPLRPSEIGAHVGLSLNRLNEILKRQGASSAGELIWERKIFLARNLLENSNRPVKDIASSLGVDDTAYFCRSFKRRTGLSPSAYRRKKRKQGPVRDG